MMHTMQAATSIPVLGEFVDALRALQRGHVLVRTSEGSGGCVIDGGIVYHSLPTLLAYQLIDEFPNPHGFKNARYYRLNERGREFAARTWREWTRRPLWQRLAARLVH